MRQKLIDVDKIKSKYNDNWPSEIAEGFQIAIDAIEDTSTIDVIPIEWIKKWKEKAADGSLCRGPIDLFDHYEYEEAIDRLLSDWKEENE